VDEEGRICREARIATHPDDLIAFLQSGNWNIVRIGLEAGFCRSWDPYGVRKLRKLSP
jgi:transposase